MTLREAIAQWYLRNASIRHGHLPDDALKLSIPEPPPASAPSATKKLLPLALAAALGGTGLAGVAGLGAWLAGAFSKADPPAASSPSEAPAFEIGDEAQQRGSLYQFLEDHDLHLPEVER
jgi:hypothetical protein